MANENQNQGGGDDQNQNQNQKQDDQNQNDQGGENQDQGGDDQNVKKLEAVKNPDGTISVGDKKFIDNDSYEAIAKKQREFTKQQEDQKRQQEEEEKKKLEEKGKWEELATKREEELNSVKEKYESQIKQNALQAEAIKLGAVDLDAVVKLSDLSKIELSEDGNVNENTVQSVVNDLKANKSYLFNEGGQKDLGSDGGAPTGGTNLVIKRSQLRDHEFYKQHEEAIKKGEYTLIDDIDG